MRCPTAAAVRIGCDEHECVRCGEQSLDPGTAVVSRPSGVQETISGGAVLGEMRGAQGDEAGDVSGACPGSPWLYAGGGAWIS